MKSLKYIIIAFTLMATFGCSDSFLEAELTTSERIKVAVNAPEDLHSFVLGVHNRMNSADYYGRAMFALGDVRGDDVTNSEGTGRFVEVGDFTMLASEGDARDLWTEIYRCIALSNLVIQDENLEETAEVLFYKGQAKALRALCYFDLNRLFGQKYIATGTDLSVPLVLEYSYDPAKEKPARNTIAEVEAQIEKDLTEAITAMSTNLVTSKAEMNCEAAQALLVRHYLYTENYAKARTSANGIFSNYTHAFAKAIDYSAMWIIKDHSESIFELAFTSTDNLGTTSLPYMYHDAGYGDFTFNKSLTDLIVGADVRSPYIDPAATNTKKFPVLNGADVNLRILRYAELVLNFAEACTKDAATSTADKTLAFTKFNELRVARGSVALATEAEMTTDVVLLERRIELAGEGHRYFDLIRNNKPYASYSGKTFTGAANDLFAFPIPEVEMDANSGLKIQNPGY